MKMLNILINTISILCYLETTVYPQASLVKDIYQGGPDSSPDDMVEINGIIYFTAEDELHGRELWKTNGTTEGTELVKDIFPGQDGSNPSEITEVNGTLFFTAEDGIHGFELWKSDGTEAGTVLIKDIQPGRDFSLPEMITDVNGTLFFFASDNTHGKELWKSDGTEEGTVLVKDLFPGRNNTIASDLININGILYFVALFYVPDNDINKQELWMSDGSATGTVPVDVVNNKVTSTSISNLFPIDDIIYFAATSSTESGKIWHTDGTEEGTFSIPGVYPVPSSNSPQFENIEHALYFQASDGTNGFELWKYQPELPCTDPAPSFTYHTACVGEPVTFTDHSTNVSPDATYLWDFGDGSTSSTVGDVVHHYPDRRGKYTVTLTITQGNCTASFSDGVAPSDPPVLSLSIALEISAPGASDGAIDLTVISKVGSLTYLWSNGATTQDIDNLTADTYSVIVTDGNGCTAEGEITLEDPQGSCFADEVVAFNQGKTKGKKISDQRSNPNLALHSPQENDTYNFVALGFGGSITLKLGQDLYDDGSYAPDLILETSFGRADQMCYNSGERNYPEMAFVEVSEDNNTWYSLPNVYCRTSFVDIGPAVEQGLSYVRYLRITDASNKSWFKGQADGYDVDGIITCREEVLAAFNRLTNARGASAPDEFMAFDPSFFNYAPNEEVAFAVKAFPNPVGGQLLHLEYTSENSGNGILRIVDMMGKAMVEKAVAIQPGFTQMEVDVAALPKGHYVLQLQFERAETVIQKVIKY